LRLQARRRIRGLLVVPGFLVATSVSASASGGFADPSPNLVFQLQKQNRAHPWLRVATDSSRWTLEVRRIDELGLDGLISRSSDPRLPDRIPWREIQRIDEVETRAHRGRVLGFLLLGAAGAGLGNALGAPKHEGGRQSLLGLAVFGSLGAWQGGRIGERFVRERPWYVAAVAPVAPPSAQELPRNLPPQRPPPSPRVLLACERIGRADLIRVQGDFGRFQGFASVVGPQGMDGLRSETIRGGFATQAVPKGLVTWDRIHRVEKRGSSMGKGAVIGGVAIGCLGGAVAAAAVTVADGSETPGTAFFEGLVVTGAVGAVLGGLIGAAIPGWHLVYRR
jgi:hypothetical protein